MSGAVDFATLTLSWRPNQFLLLPAGFEAVSEPHARSPIFNCPPQRLGAGLKSIALAEPRTKLTWEDADAGRFAFVQRSRVFRFPDTISVEVVAAGEGKSALAVYSRSKYGIRDFGVNRARVERWVAALERAEAERQTSTSSTKRARS